MKEVVVTSEGVIPLNGCFMELPSPPQVTPKAKRLAEKHGFTVKPYGTYLLLVKEGYEIKLSSTIECFKLVRVPYYWWEPCYPGYSIRKERVSTPSWVYEFSDLLRYDARGKQALDVLNSLR